MDSTPSTSPRWALLTSAAAAVGASLCCVVPLAPVSIGIGGAWIANLTALEPYRLWFAGLALVASGFAAWRLYGPASQCQDGRTCAEPRVVRRRRRLLGITTAVSRTVTLGVEHMTCATCPVTVRKALSQVSGVTKSTVDMKSHIATVTFDPSKTTPQVLAGAVSRAGFPAKVLRNGS